MSEQIPEYLSYFSLEQSTWLTLFPHESSAYKMSAQKIQLLI